MAISKSKNKKNLAKRKLRKEMQLKAEQLHNAVVITAMTNTYEKRLKEALSKHGISTAETEFDGIYKILKQNTNDISRINKRINKQLH
jgi:hypothetical protein